MYLGLKEYKVRVSYNWHQLCKFLRVLPIEIFINIDITNMQKTLNTIWLAQTLHITRPTQLLHKYEISTLIHFYK